MATRSFPTSAFIGLGGNMIDLTALRSEVDDAGLTVQLISINSTIGQVTFDFGSSTPSANDDTALNKVVEDHNGEPVEGNPPIDGRFYDSSTCVDEYAYAAGEVRTIALAHPIDIAHISVIDPAVPVLLNEVIESAAADPWEPLNRSTGDVQINDGNLAGLVYNNSVSGQTSGWIIGVDMKVATPVNAIRVYDYSAAYIATHWQFIGTNDATGATYDVLLDVPNYSEEKVNPEFFFGTFSQASYRYYGLRCVTALNASWVVWSELEVLSGTLASVKQVLKNDPSEYKVSVSGLNQIEIKNNGLARTLRLAITGRDNS